MQGLPYIGTSFWSGAHSSELRWPKLRYTTASFASCCLHVFIFHLLFEENLIYISSQDSCYEVRQKFSVKLHKALDVLKLPLDYLAFFMLSAVDPSKDRKTQVPTVNTCSQLNTYSIPITWCKFKGLFAVIFLIIYRFSSNIRRSK